MDKRHSMSSNNIYVMLQKYSMTNKSPALKIYYILFFNFQYIYIYNI